MIICVCHRVSDRDIARVAREGCASFDELQLELGVATCCGKCHDCAQATFALYAGASGNSGTIGSSAVVMHPRQPALAAAALAPSARA